MKSLFKKITGSRQLSPTTTPPPTKTRSSSQTSAIDDHQIIPLTANEVRTIMYQSTPKHRLMSSHVTVGDDIDGNSLPDRQRHRRTSTEGDMTQSYLRDQRLYSHRARARHIVQIHRNDSDPDLATGGRGELNSQLSVPVSMIEKRRRFTRSGSVDNLDELNETEKVQYRWRGHRRQPSDTSSPNIDPDIIRRELQNPVRAIYSPRNTECLVAVLEKTKGLNVNTLDKKIGEAPLHALVKKERKRRVNLVLEYVGIRGVCDVRPVRGGGGGAATTSSGDISSTDSDDGERRPLRPDGGSGACGADYGSMPNRSCGGANTNNNNTTTSENESVVLHSESDHGRVINV